MRQFHAPLVNVDQKAAKVLNLVLWLRLLVVLEGLLREVASQEEDTIGDKEIGLRFLHKTLKSRSVLFGHLLHVAVSFQELHQDGLEGRGVGFAAAEISHQSN